MCTNSLSPAFVLSTLLLCGLAAGAGGLPPQEPVAIDEVSAPILPCSEPEVTLTVEGKHIVVPMASYKDVVTTLSPGARTYISRSESYTALSQQAFWIGLGGMVAALVNEGAKFIPGRTLANGVWGIGWVMWIGYSALSQAELEDMKTQYMEDLKAIRKEKELGAYPRSNSPAPMGNAAIGWTIAEF